jgi:thioredoxin 1
MSTTLIITIVVISFIGLYIFISYRKLKNTPDVPANPAIKILNDKNFQHQIKNGTILVDFWASWCMPCRMMAPVLNEVAEELNSGAYVGKVDIEQYQSVAAKYKIRNIPTMILFKNGSEVNRFVGVKDKKFLLSQINNGK